MKYLYEDELIHRGFKYIDRYKSKSGKWVYVYADKNKHNTIKKMQALSNAAEKDRVQSYNRAITNENGSRKLYDRAKQLANAQHMGYEYYIDEFGNIEYLDRDGINSYNDMGEALHTMAQESASRALGDAIVRDAAKAKADKIINNSQSTGLNKVMSVLSKFVTVEKDPNHGFTSREKHVTGNGKSVKRR